MRRVRRSARFAHDVIGRHAVFLEMMQIPKYVGTAAAVAKGLYCMDYHFVADMMAGSFLGTAVGAAMARLGRVAVRT